MGASGLISNDSETVMGKVHSPPSTILHGRRRKCSLYVLIRIVPFTPPAQLSRQPWFGDLRPSGGEDAQSRDIVDNRCPS